MEYFYGIDFGTTNSAIVGLSVALGRLSYQQYGDSQGLPYPSFIAINKTTGEIDKGREAWEKRYELEAYCETIRSVKTFLGKPGASWSAGGRMWTPEDIAVEIFKGLKDKVATYGNILESAVVAIPVGFDAVKRKALRAAAHRAGISILSFVSEPTAAFFNCYSDLKYFKKIAVFDWGGGTLDISLIQIENEYVSERETDGDDFAGDEIDKKIAEYVHKKIAEREQVPDITFDQMPPSARESLILRCERAKIELSSKNETYIALSKYDCFAAVSYVLTREALNEVIKPNLERLLNKLMNNLRKARWSKAEIDKIILVGGSCNIPLLREMLDAQFGEKCFFPSSPDWRIAQGAATLAKEPGNYVAAHDFGVVLSDDSFFPLIEEGERINDLSKPVTFGLVEDSDDARLIFAERYKEKQDGEMTHDEFKRIGEYMSVPCFGFNSEPIEVRVTGDEDLVIKVEAKSQNRNGSHQREKIFEKAVKLRYKLPERI